VRVLVCGSRSWEDSKYIFTKLDRLNRNLGFDAVIEGCARGADSIAEDWAKSRSIQLNHFPAQWEEFGKAAGPIRNKQMLVEGKPELVIAFHVDLEKSKGTRNMVKLSRRAGIETLVYPPQ
jgi:hypothetical protein